jgi:hypothetical protein
MMVKKKEVRLLKDGPFYRDPSSIYEHIKQGYAREELRQLHIDSGCDRLDDAVQGDESHFLEEVVQKKDGEWVKRKDLEDLSFCADAWLETMEYDDFGMDDARKCAREARALAKKFKH